ncbi:MAG: nucleotide-binding protein [candidate division KSB1 bacterium]|nr:nucleotide-binding protein [candidate division KSB1 bacterium]MDZ7273331.1 nucleotide-binding protein [candidate division KSB1 bacterium]MDZ7287993.1 nucleotide-binding protein [candidate division KSB1 bacterium]MDZ7300155.1 nucleotide-binding protein [candidate division KSB1 bacterium]MDZ7309463.1 nucleotide-binding protein [candidate division KSB1 bacterium]
MKLFENRRDEKYLATLRERLSISGPNGLRQRAIRMSRVVEAEGRHFTHCCRIDFLGLAASNLLDAGGEYVPTSVADCLEEIFQQAHVLNDAGCFVKMRFLFCYPYAAYAISRIQAESTRNRSAIDEPRYVRDFKLIEQVNETTFLQSALVRNQTNGLEQIQIWVDKYGWGPQALNKVVVRFTPMSPDLCLLIMNDTAFCDAYLSAKKSRLAKRGAIVVPLIQVGSDEDRSAFAGLEDHFRYLWDHDTTLDCEDATYYQPGVPNSLRQIRPPRQIDFSKKAARLQRRNKHVSEEELNHWRFVVTRIFDRFCIDPVPAPNSESLFIACSWEKSKDQRHVPNRSARQVFEYLEEDFGFGIEKPLLEIHIMEAATGDFLTRQLYARLQQSTLAIILLTMDITSTTGERFTRPNVYHELGYLMRHLEALRLLVLCEEGVNVPSNIHDLVRVDFTTNKLALCYRDILDWLAHATTFVPRPTIVQACRHHIKRLEQLVEKGWLSTDEVEMAKQRLLNDIDRVKKS